MKLAESNRHLGGTRAEDITGLRDDLFTGIPSPESDSSDASFQSSDVRFEEIKHLVESWTTRATSLQKEQDIIESLYFDDMPYRRDTILDAWAETFRWIHDKKFHFREWLEAEEGVYWISGHAGSGKSTLIKFLSTNNAIHEDLLRWAGSKKLVKASFHFWFSGSDLQKSQEGLLRSLLFEIFRQCPSIIPSACPERWQENAHRPWSRHELMDTFKRLHLQSPDTRFCFFIDGLDEYQDQSFTLSRGEDSPAAHVSDIIDIMATLSKLKDVKLCLSSRPWQAFEQAYGACETRKLYVDQENGEDIRLYVRDKLENSESFKRTQVGAVASEMTEIVEEIVRDSKGVFLWVALVIESLLRGLTNQDRVSELRRRLSEIPKTLNGMFERMLSSVEDRYQEEAVQILQVALYANSPLKLFTYLHIGDSEYSALNTPTRGWTKEECFNLAKETETRIKVRCPDLIKVNDCSEPGETLDAQSHILVDFLHRTARDFLTLEDTQNRLKQRLKQEFDPGQYICDALVGQIKGADPETSEHWDFENLDLDGSRGVQGDFMELLDHAKKGELCTNTSQRALLDEMQSVMALQGWSDPSISFLGLMVARDMQLYVKEHLPDAIVSHGGTVPLLQCALLPPVKYSNILITGFPLVEMVSLLLDYGANPNEKSSQGEDTIWKCFLKERYRKRKNQNKKPSDHDRANFSIMQAMLEHGADPHVQCLFKPRKGDSATMDLVEMLKDMFWEEDVAYLESVILHRREVAQQELESPSSSEAVSRESSWGLTFGVQRSLDWLRLPFSW